MVKENQEVAATKKSDIYKISPLNIVVKEGFNSRINFEIDELAGQIKEQGVLNPISVVPFTDENGNEKYRLVDGERRYRAVMKLINDGVDIQRVPALFISKSVSEEELLIQQGMRNEGRTFTSYEWGILVKKIMNVSGKSIAEVARMIGKNIGAMSRAVGYLEYEPELQEIMKNYTMSPENVDRVITAHKGNQRAAIAEINKTLAQKEDTKEVKAGKAKLSLKDFDKNSHTIDFKNSLAVKKGIDALYRALGDFAKENPDSNIQIDLGVVYNKLKEGKLLNEIFKEFDTNTKVIKKAE